MYRAIPSANKILSAKWQNKEHEMHKQNLMNIKSTVDSRQPNKYKHLEKKQKKTQMLEERYTEIERENRILLEKMTNILQKQRGQVYTANAIVAGQSQIQEREKSMMGNTAQDFGMPLTAGGKRSLNRDARKRELTKITKENQLILKRLQDKSANYNVSRWQRDEIKRKQVLTNICEYPLIDKEGGVNGQPDFIIKKKVKSASVGNAFYKKTRGYTQGQNQMQPNSFAANQIIKKETLYTGVNDLGNGSYNIEMLISQTDDLVISAQHLELPDSFIIEIENSKVDHLISEFNHDFGLMANHLKIMNKRMVLLNPKFIIKEENQQNDGQQEIDQDEEEQQQQDHDQNVQQEVEQHNSQPVNIEMEKPVETPAQNNFSAPAGGEQPPAQEANASGQVLSTKQEDYSQEFTPAVSANQLQPESSVAQTASNPEQHKNIDSKQPNSNSTAELPDTVYQSNTKGQVISQQEEVRESQEHLPETNKAVGEKKIEVNAAQGSQQVEYDESPMAEGDKAQ